MVNALQLLRDLQRLLKTLEDDLRERAGEVSEIDAALREQYRGAKEAGRTGDAYEVWRDEFLTQAAVAWILGCVFVRFLEDNRLIPTPLLSGPGERRQRALDEHELYFRQPERRTYSDRDYLLHVFEQVRGFPAAAELFDAKHNPLWAVGPTGDGATQLLRFWQRVNPDTGELEHDFTHLPSPSGRGAGGEGSYCRSGLTTLAPGEGDNSPSPEGDKSPSPSGRGVGVRGISQPPAAGYLGMITANSFMKREFGKKLIKEFFPRVDLTHVIDTSGAYIPGHGTPTVILFARDRAPVGDTVRTVMGIKGEPATPEDPSKGLVWSAIVSQVDRAGSESEWVSVADTPRETFGRHPWSIGGGGAAELRESLDDMAAGCLAAEHVDIGFLVITGEDNCLLLEPDVVRREHLISAKIPVGDGEALRDWSCTTSLECLWPYDRLEGNLDSAAIETYLRFLWPYRSTLRGRKVFGVPVEQKGLRWWDIREVYRERLQSALSISFAFVATHNHFVLDRGGKVFKQSAPVIKLPAGASEDDHLALIGLLNSSTACFWMKQVFYPKGGDHVGQEGARVRKTLWDERYEFTGTGLKQFPVADEKPLDLARELDRLARELAACSPAALLAEEEVHHEGTKRTKEEQSKESSCPSCLRGEKSKAIEAEQRRRKQQEIGDIPPPPKYKSADFLNTTFWRLRGALDVPKERFVSYPHCSKTSDPSLVVAWAGWDHLQQAQALAAYYLNIKEQEGWTPERLTPLLAGLPELIPWIRQWHNDPDPNFSGARMGDYFESFVDEEARELGLTPEQIRSWQPPDKGIRTRRLSNRRDAR